MGRGREAHPLAVVLRALPGPRDAGLGGVDCQRRGRGDILRRVARNKVAGRKPLGSKWLVGSSHGASGCDYRRGLGMGYGRGACDQPTTKPTEQEIKALLDKLVSPNPKPITDEDRDKHMAPDRQSPALDEKKQGEVRRARIELRKLGSDTFQFLIDRWKDDRYSLTVENMLSGYSRNQSVGRVCQTILYDQIQPYGYWQSSGGPDPRSKPMRPCRPLRGNGRRHLPLRSSAPRLAPVVVGDHRAKAGGRGSGSRGGGPGRLIFVADVAKFGKARLQEPGLRDTEIQKSITTLPPA